MMFNEIKIIIFDNDDSWWFINDQRDDYGGWPVRRLESNDTLD